MSEEPTPPAAAVSTARGDPSTFLRDRIEVWMGGVAAAGRTTDLFELEMWLRTFERFFRIKNQPLSEKETRQLALRNWSEELRLVDNVLLRVIALCDGIVTEDHVNATRFDKYIESYLRKDDVVDPYIEKLLRHATPEAELTLLRESFEDIHVALMELVKLSRVPFPTFGAVGKILYREVRRSHLLCYLLDKKFKPMYDRIGNPALSALIRSMADESRRRQVARVFLELFRLLHYLDYADPARNDEENLKNTVLIFSLITADTRLLLNYIEKKALKGLDPEDPLHQLYDSFVYCLPLELKKVINTELLDISAARQADNVRARVENSHGILKDCFQQSVVQLAQVVAPAVEGQEVFTDFTAKREQSLQLRDGLGRLIKAVRDFQLRKEEAAAVRLKEEISDFYDHHMRYLMYRDWSGFELFFIEILKCTSLAGLLQISHRFETFLMTLYREVLKRSILRDTPLPEELQGLEAPA